MLTTESRFYEVLQKETPWKEKNLRFYAGRLFDGVELAGKSMLEIGAGEGAFSFFAVSVGARKAVALEPEAAGSTSGVQARFSCIKEKLGVDNVELLPLTFQQFDPAEEMFDVVLLHNSVNHLDENACIHLHQDPQAWGTYRALFGRIAAMLTPGGKLILADCSRHNFFAWLGLTNPVASTIEWHKHQPPELWARLGREVGLTDPQVTWKSFSPLGAIGALFLANKAAAFFLMSHFRLCMTKRGS